MTYPDNVMELERHRYASATGWLEYFPASLRSRPSPAQASSNRSRASALHPVAWTSVARLAAPSARWSKMPSETAVNIIFERRKASIRSTIGEGSGGAIGRMPPDIVFDCISIQEA